MVPASGGHLSGGWNHAGSFSYDLISSELLLEHDFLKIDFIGWSPTVDHIKVAVGHPRVTIGHLRVIMSHLRLAIGYL